VLRENRFRIKKNLNVELQTVGVPTSFKKSQKFIVKVKLHVF